METVSVALNTTADPAADTPSSAVLELKSVGKVSGTFNVPAYQRGYRWGEVEVRALLNDLHESVGSGYCLQPIVVKRAAGEWELIDGQQRLTTLYLLFKYIADSLLRNASAPWTIRYETRPACASFLEDLDAARRDENIDFNHMYGAYHVIRTWFDEHKELRHDVAMKLYPHLNTQVKVIWYEVPDEVDSVALFARLNMGRIPLTDAELFKALLVSSSDSRATELIASWDMIERDLHEPRFWAFISRLRPDEQPSRIGLLLDVLADQIKPLGMTRRPTFWTFEVLRSVIQGNGSDDAEERSLHLWDRVVDMYSLFRGWFDDASLFNSVGYLVAIGDDIGEIVRLTGGLSKSGVIRALQERITERLKLTSSKVRDLVYDRPEPCRNVLLLMNVEHMRVHGEPFPFHRYREGSWSLEHIHAQHAEQLTTVEQWQAWLREHLEALSRMTGVDDVRRNELAARMTSLLKAGLDRATFAAVARDVIDYFTGEEDRSIGDRDQTHSISNLALLNSATNSALSNAVFEVKRQRLLVLDKHGEWIPPCTRNVFLKYYATDGVHYHFWGTADREGYRDEMLALLDPYLLPEAKP